MKKVFYYLEGLEGLPKKQKVKALFIRNMHHFEVRFRLYGALTAAGPNGALNIWRDDKGLFRAEFMRFCNPVACITSEDFEIIQAWTKTNFKHIK